MIYHAYGVLVAVEEDIEGLPRLQAHELNRLIDLPPVTFISVIRTLIIAKGKLL